MSTRRNRYPIQHRNVAVLGGIMTLQPQYRRVLEEKNLCARIFNRDAAGIWGKVGGSDVIILFTGTISHRMAIRARKTAASCGIPVVTVARSSISALRKSISGLTCFAREGAWAKGEQKGDRRPDGGVRQ